MLPVRFGIALTGDGTGSATGFTSGPVSGRILQVLYTPGTAGFANASVITITGEETGTVIQTITTSGTAAFQTRPKQNVSGPTGTVGIYAAGATTMDDVIIANERVKVLASNIGANKSGTVSIIVG